MIDLGVVRPGSTLRIPFSSFDKDDGSSITMTSFAVADILIYKDGDTAERASTSGYTATTDFDTKTGKHLAIITLSDNGTAGFFSAGSEYNVAIDAVTVDAVTTGGWIARFVIGYDAAILNTTIATLSTQTSFTLTAGPAEDDALNGMWAIIHDVASAVQWSCVIISDYTGSTKTVTLAAGATFTAAATDNFSVMAPMPMQPSVMGRQPVVSAAGVVDGNVVNIAGATVSTTTAQLGVNAVQAGGTAWGAGAITAGSIASDAITAAKVAADVSSEIADQVWDEAIAGHLSAGSTGLALNSAGSAGDPWSTAVPGAYAAGTAGNILGNRLDAAVTSRLAPAVAARTLAVSAGGAAKLDWANVETPGSTVALTGTSIATSQVVASVTGAVGSVTGLTAANLDTTVSSRSSLTAAQVNAEVVDVLNVDTYVEPTAVPAATTTLVNKIGWLFSLARNKRTQTSTTQTLRNDADSGNIATSTVDDDGTTASRGEWS